MSQWCQLPKSFHKFLEILTSSLLPLFMHTSRVQGDLLCVEWDVNPTNSTQFAHISSSYSLPLLSLSPL